MFITLGRNGKNQIQIPPRAVELALKNYWNEILMQCHLFKHLKWSKSYSVLILAIRVKSSARALNGNVELLYLFNIKHADSELTQLTICVFYWSQSYKLQRHTGWPQKYTDTEEWIETRQSQCLNMTFWPRWRQSTRKDWSNLELQSSHVISKKTRFGWIVGWVDKFISPVIIYANVFWQSHYTVTS